MVKKLNPTTFEIRRMVEYRDFFVGEKPIDIPATLKGFDRDTLVRMAAILSLHYGNMAWPNEIAFFSDTSKKHIPYLNDLFRSYYSKLKLVPGQKVEILTYRTSLELWRQVFAIHTEEFTSEVKDDDVELTLFKVVLSINEKIVNFTERKEKYKLDELIFLNCFLTNDSNNYGLKNVIQPQLYYFHQLINFIPSNEVLSKATEMLFSRWGITSWQQYYTTLFIIASETDGYITRRDNGVPIITNNWIQENPRFLSPSLIEHLSIDENEFIPYNDDSAAKKKLNVDYRKFRSCPFVKLKDGSGYVVINNQLVCERLYNSLFFDFSPLINGKKGSVGFFDYNKSFVEKILFRNAFFKCLPSDCYSFPAKDELIAEEKPKEPDFYARTKRDELIIVECKAVKMNGECRDDGDYSRLLDELHEKIVRKTRNLDPTRKEHKGDSEPMGVGQLIQHIDSIEADTFEWDTSIPDDVCYYLLLVFEDVKLVQKGILSMVNRWFFEDVDKEWKDLDLSAISCKPIMVVSINTLYLYDDFLRRRGLTKVIDAFTRENMKYDDSGWYKISPMADFDEYLRNNTYNKRGDMMKWHKQLLIELESTETNS